jgi:hypothetical protein
MIAEHIKTLREREAYLRERIRAKKSVGGGNAI